MLLSYTVKIYGNFSKPILRETILSMITNLKLNNLSIQFKKLEKKSKFDRVKYSIFMIWTNNKKHILLNSRTLAFIDQQKTVHFNSEFYNTEEESVVLSQFCCKEVFLFPSHL